MVKNDPKIMSKSNKRIYGNIENESCSTTWVDPNIVFDPKKSKMTPKLSQNQMSELKET